MLLGTFAIAAALSAHACDLWRCFTPQLEALSQPDKAELSGQPAGTTARTRSWTSGLYGTVAEQFTHFGTVQVDGNEGIHGHDLTLGTGSYDGIFGGQTSLRYKNFFLDQEAQFALRGDGQHQYHFANDLSWNGGPGYYVVRHANTIVGLQAVISGEHKDLDRFRGKPATDTGITSVFVGPGFVVSLGGISVEAGIDLPVLIDNTALRTVPDYRVRAAISLRF